MKHENQNQFWIHNLGPSQNPQSQTGYQNPHNEQFENKINNWVLKFKIGGITKPRSTNRVLIEIHLISNTKKEIWENWIHTGEGDKKQRGYLGRRETGDFWGVYYKRLWEWSSTLCRRTDIDRFEGGSLSDRVFGISPMGYSSYFMKFWKQYSYSIAGINKKKPASRGKHPLFFSPVLFFSFPSCLKRKMILRVVKKICKLRKIFLNEIRGAGRIQGALPQVRSNFDSSSLGWVWIILEFIHL